MVPTSERTPLTSVRVAGGGSPTHSSSPSSSDRSHPGTLLKIALSCTTALLLLLCAVGVSRARAGAGVFHSSPSVVSPVVKLSQAEAAALPRACTFKDLDTGLKLHPLPAAVDAQETGGAAPPPCGLIRQGLTLIVFILQKLRNPSPEERTRQPWTAREVVRVIARSVVRSPVTDTAPLIRAFPSVWQPAATARS